MGTKIDVEELAGTLFALQTVIAALVNTHPNKERLLESLNASGAGVLAAMSTSLSTEKSRAVARDVLERLQKSVEQRIQANRG